MKKNLLKWAFVAFAMMALVGCKKDGKTSDNPSNPILSGSWRLAKYEVRLADSSWAQVAFPTGLADDRFAFHSDGTYTVTSDGVQLGTGSWSLYDNGQTMSMGNTVYHIVVLNSTTMELVNTEETFNYVVNGSGTKVYGERATYSH